jgi:hypothetical protein
MLEVFVSCCALFKRMWSTLLQKVVPEGHCMKNIENYVQEEENFEYLV